MRFQNSILSICFAGILAGCTEPMDTTQMAAATGGVLGAGLGAIVGSQTGDPGAGLVLGAAAGAAGGGMIGHTFQMHEEALRNQEEAIERQEKMIAAQRSELQELRRMNQDTPRYRLNSSFNQRPQAVTRQPQSVRPSANLTAQKRPVSVKPVRPTAGAAAYKAPVQRQVRPVVRQPAASIQERSLKEPETSYVAPVKAELPVKSKSYSETLYDSVPVLEEEKVELKGAGDPTFKQQEFKDEPLALAAVNQAQPQGSDCIQAQEEIAKAKVSADTSDKLFHTRRAIRLCSHMPSYHQALGEVYLSLNRKEDALFEFQEALKYDPTYAPAIEASRKLQGKSGGFSASDKY